MDSVLVTRAAWAGLLQWALSRHHPPWLSHENLGRPAPAFDEDTTMYLLIFLYFISGEPVPLLESAWYAERAQCEAAVASMSDSAMASDVIVLVGKCVEGLL